MEKKNGSWTIKHRENVLANDFVEVYRDEVIKPDGTGGEFVTVRFVEGAAVLPVDDGENVYLTKQFRYAIERENIEVAAGVVEDEDYLATARREALEELGVEAEHWADFGFVEENTSITRSRIKLYLARKITVREPEPEVNEQITVLKMPLAEALEKVMSGEITHDLTCVLVLKTARLLGGIQ